MLRSTLLLLLVYSLPVLSQNVLLDKSVVDTVHVNVLSTTYKGKSCLHVTGTNAGLSEMAILKNIDFSNGVIEVDVSGDRLPGTDTSYRGFIGIAFRIPQDDSHYECVYLRPTLGRTEDQLRRNHSTQYVAMPDYPWQLLREKSPGVYESYADMVAGEWIHLKIVVQDKKAKLFIDNNTQPSLIINNLLNTETGGRIALWIGPGTDGYFANLKITK